MGLIRLLIEASSPLGLEMGRWKWTLTQQEGPQHRGRMRVSAGACSRFRSGSGRQQQPVLLPPWVRPFHSIQLSVPWRVLGGRAKARLFLVRYQFPGRA